MLGKQANAFRVAIAALICSGERQGNERARKAQASGVTLRLDRRAVGTHRAAYWKCIEPAVPVQPGGSPFIKHVSEAPRLQRTRCLRRHNRFCY
jgi:hypothetical protein